MADYMRDIYPLIAKPLQVAQQQLNWLKGFQAQQQQQQQQQSFYPGYNQQGNYPYTTFSNGWGNTNTYNPSYNPGPYNSQYPIPAYNPASSFQMQQLQQLMQQSAQNTSAGSTSASNANTTSSNFRIGNNPNPFIALLLPILLQQLLNRDNDEDSDANTPADPPATAKIKSLLAKTAADDDTSDTDNDGFVIGPADYASLKAAMNDNQFTKADLENSLGGLLLTSELEKVDELSKLFAMAQDDGIVDVENVLKPEVLSALSDQRQDQLGQALAENGLVKAGGSNNQDLTTFLITSLDKPTDSKENVFARLTLKKLVNQWILNPQVALPNPDTTQLHNLLKLLGFKYTDEAGLTLAPDAEQPFPIGIVAPPEPAIPIIPDPVGPVPPEPQPIDMDESAPVEPDPQPIVIDDPAPVEPDPQPIVIDDPAPVEPDPQPIDMDESAPVEPEPQPIVIDDPVLVEPTEEEIL